jgi:hypothetical protein
MHWKNFCVAHSLIPRIAIGCAAIVWSIPAYAYLDPATGSVILQGLLAGIAGVMVVARLYWTRIKSFTRRLFGMREPVDPFASPSDPAVQNERK